MKDLTQGNIYKTFFLFGLPLVLSGLLSQTYQIVDTAIAGKFIGESGLAAMGATSPLISAISSLFWGYGVGFSMYIARLFAAKEYAKLKSAIATSYLAITFLCFSFAVIALLFNEQLFDLLKVSESLRSDALKYFSVYILGLFVIILNTCNVFIMNSFGIGSFPFYMSLVSAALNVSGNLLCVLVFKIGVEGLAYSTVFASLVIDVVFFFKLKKCFSEMGVGNEKMKLRLAHLKNSFPYAIPNMAQQGIMYAASLLISPLVNGIGPQASASYSVVMQVYNLNASVYQNSTRSLSNYTAQCAGKNEYHKIKKGVFVGLLQGLIFLSPFLLGCVIFHEQICSLFFKADADAVTREYAYLFVEKYLPFIVINLLNNLLHGLYKGVKATGHLFTSTFVGAVTQYVAAASLIPKMGMEGFFLGWIISWAIEALFSGGLYFLGFWNPARKEKKVSR